LREAKEIAGGFGEEHFRGERQLACGSGRVGSDAQQGGIGGFKDRGERDGCDGSGLSVASYAARPRWWWTRVDFTF
jgi:hypothetical protein